MKVVLYARVSTKDKGQDTENQLAQLREFCSRQEWKIIAEYVDRKTGSTSDREEFGKMFEDAGRRKFDLVLFWALDRFSREGALATLKHLERLTSAGVGWKSYTEQYLDSAGMFKDAIISIMATLAKQERVRIQERTMAGLDRARREGKTLGPPRKIFDREKVRSLRREGLSLREIGEELGIGKDLAAKTLAGV